MPACIITGIETNNKFKNIPVCTEMLVEARKLVKEEDQPDLRTALKFLQRSWKKQMQKIEQEKLAEIINGSGAEVFTVHVEGKETFTCNKQEVWTVVGHLRNGTKKFVIQPVKDEDSQA